MTIEGHAKKRTITIDELLSLTQEQMEEISKFDGKRKRRPLTYEQRLKISMAQNKRLFEKRHKQDGNV